MSKQNVIREHGVTFAALLFVGVVLSLSFWFTHDRVNSLERYANGILKECAASTYRPTCYEEKIPKLMEKISMEEAFSVTALVQEKDPSYAYCHVLGHKLSAKETSKDPLRWESVIPRCPSGVCSNGCIHGAFQERFRKESFEPEEIKEYKPVFSAICEAKPGWNPTGMEQASCYHALGHLIMYVTKADIEKAISLCQEVSIKEGGRRNMSELCFDGAFMQIFQPLEPDDFALIEGKEVKKESAETFCNTFSGQAQVSCRSESWPLYRAEFKDPVRVISFCEYLPEESGRNRCFNSLLYVLTAQSNFNGEAMKTFCSKMPEGKRGACFAYAASRMLENDYRSLSRAVQFCDSAVESDKEGACYQELSRYAGFNFHPGSPEFMELCSLLPGKWKESCLTRTYN